MTIVVTDIGTAGNASGATVPFTVGPAGVAAGFIGVSICDKSVSVLPGTIADSKGNTYVKAVSVDLNNNSANGSAAIFYAYNTTALVQNDTITYTKAVTGSVAVMSILGATGISTSSDPIDSAATATNFGNGTAPTVTSGTPGTAGDLFLASFSVNGGGLTVTQASGWAAPFTAISSTTAAETYGGNLINAGTGTKTYNPTFGGANKSWGDVICAFKPGVDPSDIPSRGVFILP